MVEGLWLWGNETVKLWWESWKIKIMKWDHQGFELFINFFIFMKILKYIKNKHNIGLMLEF